MRVHRPGFTTLIAAATLVLGACGVPAGESGMTPPAEETSTTTDETTSSPSSTSPDDTSDEEHQELEEVLAVPEAHQPGVAYAIADLAERLDLSVEDITVVEVEQITWRDGSLGCPQPGMSYTQALVEGLRIILEADGEEYAYHSGGSRPPFLCEQAPTVPGDVRGADSFGGDVGTGTGSSSDW